MRRATALPPSSSIAAAVTVCGAPTLPVGAIDTRASGWWAMIFVLCTEGALFGYLLFSYCYFASQAHSVGYFLPGGPPSLTLALPPSPTQAVVELRARGAIRRPVWNRFAP